MQVAAFLHDEQLPKLARLLARPIRTWLQRWAAYGGPGPGRRFVQNDTRDTATASQAEQNRTVAHGSEPPRQRQRVLDSAVDLSPNETAAERALDVLQAIPPSAAIAALAATRCGLGLMLAALRPELHSAALQAHCTAGPPGKLRLCIIFAADQGRCVSRSGVSVAATALRTLGRLTSFKACAITPTGVCDIMRACCGLKQLSRLTFHLLKGSRLWPGFEREFARLNHVRALSLEVDAIGPAAQLGERHELLPFILVGVLPGLERLRCRDVFVDGAGTGSLLPACASTALTWLDIRGHTLGDCTALAACTEQLDGAARLRRLDVGYCGLTGNGAVALAAALPPLPELTYLSLCYNSKLGTGGLAAVAQIIGRAAALRSIDLSGMQLCHLQDTPLAAALAAATALTALTCTNAQLRDAGTLALAAEVLPSLTNLRMLDLQDNNITELAAEVLVASLKRLPAVRRVLLWGCGEMEAISSTSRRLQGELNESARQLADEACCSDSAMRGAEASPTWSSDVGGCCTSSSSGGSSEPSDCDDNATDSDDGAVAPAD